MIRVHSLKQIKETKRSRFSANCCLARQTAIERRRQTTVRESRAVQDAL